MLVFPNAKINLGLHVISKRKDGYHNIETVFFPVPWCDVLEILMAAETGNTLTQTGIKFTAPAEDNLVMKACNFIRRKYKIGPVKTHLHKIVPAGSGLGGGSSDAAFTLLTLNKLFNLKIPDASLLKDASELGSDCAFFVRNKPSLATGRGEVFEDIDVNLKGYFLVIVKPKISVSTAEAYKNIVPGKPAQSIPGILKMPVSEWKHFLKNDFEKTIFKKYPGIARIKEKLYKSGALYASMSGSGSAVYGIFEKEQDMKSMFRGSTVWQGKLR